VVAISLSGRVCGVVPFARFLFLSVPREKKNSPQVRKAKMKEKKKKDLFEEQINRIYFFFLFFLKVKEEKIQTNRRKKGRKVEFTESSFVVGFFSFLFFPLFLDVVGGGFVCL
jgi:hypothetical protein